MENNGTSTPLVMGILDTLAQTETKSIPVTLKNQILFGEGSDLSDIESLQSRSKKKTISQKIVLSLIDVDKRKGNFKLKKTLWNTYHCNSKVTSGGGRLYTPYCRNRICSICSGIRKAEMIRKLYPILNEWKQPIFVTLTAKAVPATSLNKRMKDMNRGLRKIILKYKKKAQRGTGIKLIGFHTLECNFNFTKRTYNPHLHLIVMNEEMANIIISEWLALCTKKFASPKAQLGIPVIDKEKGLIEVIKYNTKQFSKPDPSVKHKKVTPYVYTSAMYNILVSLQGIRSLDRFGFNYPKSEKNNKISEAADIEHWIYNDQVNDWLNSKRQRLSAYIPTQELLEILTKNIDSESE